MLESWGGLHSLHTFATRLFLNPLLMQAMAGPLSIWSLLFSRIFPDATPVWQWSEKQGDTLPSTATNRCIHGRVQEALREMFSFLL